MQIGVKTKILSDLLENVYTTHYEGTKCKFDWF